MSSFPLSGLKRWLSLSKEDKLKPLDSEPDPSVSVFTVTSRHSPYHRWEPIYIGSQEDPLYDERLSWEGFQDKMSQMHELCLMNYRYGMRIVVISKETILERADLFALQL